MAGRLGIAIGLVVAARTAGAQASCPVAAVPFRTVAASIQGTIGRIGAADSDQVRSRLDSVRVQLPDDFAYTVSSIGRGSIGAAAHRSQSLQAMRNAMPGRDGVMQRVLNRLFQSTVQAAIDSVGVRASLEPVEQMMCLAREVRLMEGTEKLRQFERKFGPESVKLNGLEVLLNYGAQFLPWPPLFGVSDDFSPRPWEIVAGYRTTYVTLARSSPGGSRSPQAVSVAELGLRRYNFGKTWGNPDAGWLMRAIKPGVVSLGVVVASESNGALRNPFHGDARVGPYLAWGGLKVGLLTGSDRRVIVSRDVLVIPYVF